MKCTGFSHTRLMTRAETCLSSSVVSTVRSPYVTFKYDNRTFNNPITVSDVHPDTTVPWRDSATANEEQREGATGILGIKAFP